VHGGCIIWKKEVFLMHIGEKIKARRLSLGWSQRELAAKMGYKNHSVIARVEAGSVDLPQSRLDQFAKVLGVTHGYLLGMVTEEQSKKNDQLAMLIVKMRSDVDFYNTVAALAELNEKQYQGVKQLIAAFNE
jgi:transcriptional regulator with XRE-family HTH domain